MSKVCEPESGSIPRLIMTSHTGRC
jgi:hypothetical protein